jgi:hypothetical protein
MKQWKNFTGMVSVIEGLSNMKTIFLEIDGVLNNITSNAMGGILNRSNTDVIKIAASTIAEPSIQQLNRLFESVQNMWIVLTSSWRNQIDIKEVRQILFISGFNFSHRVFDITPFKPNNKPGQVCNWLREHAVESETNSFVILDSKYIMGLLENFSVKTDPDIGLTKQNVDIMINGFRHQEYRLAKIWHLIEKK